MVSFTDQAALPPGKRTPEAHCIVNWVPLTSQSTCFEEEKDILLYRKPNHDSSNVKSVQ
jgi:hypothetical protein